jgi:hypothetical protein
MRFKEGRKTKSNANTEVSEEFATKYKVTPEVDGEFKTNAKGTASREVSSH